MENARRSKVAAARTRLGRNAKGVLKEEAGPQEISSLSPLMTLLEKNVALSLREAARDLFPCG
jgi:hypothetical protein